MSLLSADGPGQGCSTRLVAIFGVLKWKLAVIKSDRGFWSKLVHKLGSFLFTA